MKKITLNYSADLDWVDSLTKQLDGEIEGNHILIPDTIHTGDRYYLKCREGIVAQYLDVTYHTDLQVIGKNKKNDFIGIYYNLSEGNPILTLDSISNNMGRDLYNLSLLDSSLDFKYTITKGSKAFMFCIFIKKELIKSYIQNNTTLGKKINTILDPEKNTCVVFDRMSNESYHALTDLRKLKVGGTLFDLNLIGTVHLLISDYLSKLLEKEIIIQLVNESDLSGIISAQHFLIESLENPYPGTKVIAEKFNMSESKFKRTFKKITGLTPNSFFMDNKLIKCKKLLEEKQWSINEVSKQFGFTDSSYFAGKFKKKFGITPKKFTQQL